VIESFRNGLYEGYKTSAGVDPELLSQFSLAEEAVSALGLVVWPMIEFEADDALATAARRFGRLKSVEQVVICSPDKDLTQLVSDNRVVCWDRRRELIIDEKAVEEKYGVLPESIPDWLGLVGDSADGFPGVPGWGAKSASSVLSRYRHLESVPADPSKWDVPAISAGRAASLAASLQEHHQEAQLFRQLATLRSDVPLREKLSDLQWRGALPHFKVICHTLGDDKLPLRIERWQPA
jgi:5'-3' exonuclease